MLKKKIHKVIAVYLAINLLAEMFCPTVALALTGGPSQPEVESFEPVGTTEMVDVFSGDFNYNIPLLTVPGPNGGYPINLAYHAGIGMEQEASWVGLGWNINPGEINRQMRGLPDDFNGDEVNKKISYRPTWTFGLDAKRNYTNKEILGANIKTTWTQQVYWNNYKGLGYRIGLESVGAVKDQSRSSHSPLSVNVSYDSQNGLGINPDLSYRQGFTSKEYSYHLGLNYTSRQGLTGITLKVERRNIYYQDHCGYQPGSDFYDQNNKDYYYADNTSKGASVGFVSSSFVPGIQTPMFGFNAAIKLKFGSEQAFGIFKNRTIRATYTMDFIKKDFRDKNIPAYGYMYSQNRVGENKDLALMDFNREKDVPVTKDAVALPIPQLTHDVYMVKGQGIGGVFRPNRGDVGIVYDERMVNDNVGGDIGFDTGGGSNIHFGGNFGAAYAHHYSGNWLAKKDELDAVAGFKSSSANDPLFEPFYFKASGEQTSYDYTGYDPDSRYQNESAVLFGIKMKYSGEAFEPKVYNNTSATKGGTDLITGNQREKRERRSQNMEYRTVAQIKRAPVEQPRVSHIWGLYQYPGTNGAQSAYSYTNSFNKDSHIGSISVLNPDGNRYEYALPAYNLLQKDVAFSVDPNNGNTSLALGKKISYSATDASTDNKKNDDRYFSSTSMPAYAHSYMLTAIYSPDYVDLTGNGPTDDDFGYYVKFNYSKLPTDYKWRVPYYDANYAKGYYSSTVDDKASYTYGEKEIWYVNSIETKTHIVRFTLSERRDGYGAKEEHNTNTGPSGLDASQRLMKLDEIRLYSKTDPGYINGTAVPIKTVHFEYSYELCPLVNNNDGFSQDKLNNIPALECNGGDINTARGKLTLKRVWFSYLNNGKGQLSPYQFQYSSFNPSYSVMTADRWGNYKPDDPANGIINEENPYVVQEDPNLSPLLPNVNTYMSAWNLTKIILPSCGEINVEYESDDYAYVQDKQALQMMEVVATGQPNSSPNTFLDKNNRIVYFKLEPGQNNIDDYISGLDEIYFKIYMNLKKNGAGQEAEDYVEGYAKIDQNGPKGITTLNVSWYNNSQAVQVGYFTVKEVKVADGDNINLGKTHPFRKAGWQYLKLQRPDLLYPGNNNNVGTRPKLRQLANTVVSIYNDARQLIMGYYNACAVGGYCARLGNTRFQGGKPSFVRVKTPDRIKHGGGHRVKQISINDNWASMDPQQSSYNYGQEYTYRMPDGSSSGVAEYEPLIGGEEIPLRKPLRYSSERFLIKHNDLYLEEPLGESYFPSPNVGYRRIVVKSLKRTDGQGNEINKATSPGITVNEFYTAFDYPVVADGRTVLTHKGYSPFFILPFIGMISFGIHGYSQGYKIELNDMHGKPKSIATYAYTSNINDPNTVPVSKTEYIYSTAGSYNPNGNNKLVNMVMILDGDGVSRLGKLGVTTDFFVDMRQHSGTASSIGFDLNADVTGVIAVPSWWPAIQFSETMFRSVVSMKVINRTGIISEIRQFNEGSWVSTKNLMFDSETGRPLLTQVTNDFEKPVFNYTYAAHWNYEGMGGAYKNIGVTFDNFITDAQGNYLVPNANSYFFPGDEVEVTIVPNETGFPKKYWVVSADNTKAELVDKDGAKPQASLGHVSLPLGLKTVYTTVVRSGRRNQLSMSNGSLVTLNNPLPHPGNATDMKVLNASAAEFSDTWSFDYGDVGNPKVAPGTPLTSAIASASPYRYGTKGIWRNKRGFVYQVDREQTSPATNIAVDGTFKQFNYFNWNDPINNNPNWTWTSEVTRYNPYGFELENKDRLGIFSSALYGYNNSLVTSVASNTSYFEGAFDGFEDYISITNPNIYLLGQGHGHLNLKYTGNQQIGALSSTEAHTGKFSVRIDNVNGPGPVEFNTSVNNTATVFAPEAGKKYIATAWFKSDNPSHAPELTVTGAGVNLSSVVSRVSPEKIEGWQRVETEFTTTTAGVVNFMFAFNTGSINDVAYSGYIDDIRIQPFRSGMKTYVYDPKTLWLVAELDDRNYATFYNYDEEGNLVQVKKETVKGIMTLKTYRKNMKRCYNPTCCFDQGG